MADLRKFYADIQRIMKYDRADHAGTYDGRRAAKAAAELFETQNRQLCSIAAPLSNYWYEKYIANTPDASAVPSMEHIDWLAAALNLLDGKLESDQNFSADDWAEIRDIVSAEAEDLPIDVVSSIMSVMLDRGAF